MTSKYKKNGRRPLKKKMEDEPPKNWKTTFNKKLKTALKKNGRRPQNKMGKNEDDIKKKISS
jgi:hypothetical protein